MKTKWTNDEYGTVRGRSYLSSSWGYKCSATSEDLLIPFCVIFGLVSVCIACRRSKSDNARARTMEVLRGAVSLRCAVLCCPVCSVWWWLRCVCACVCV